MSVEDAPNNELERHITMFPSKFDGTSIACQLRKINAPTMLYADVRDLLWLKNQKLRTEKESYERQINALKEYVGGL